MEEVKQKSWFGRNWIWVVPVGGCLTLIVLAVLGIGTIFFGVTKMFKSSTPYEYAFTEASNNPKVIHILGEPIESSGMVNGNISFNNDAGEANFSIPVKGPNGKGKIVVLGEKEAGVWTYEKLYFIEKETGKKINLLKKELEGI